MSDNNIECYGELVSEVLTAISQVYWGRMYKYINPHCINKEWILNKWTEMITDCVDINNAEILV